VHLARGEMLSQGGRHLRSASVLDADEKEFGNRLDKASIGLCGSGELLPCESGDQYWQEIQDGRRWLQGLAGIRNGLGNRVPREGAFVGVGEIVDQAVVVDTSSRWLVGGLSGGGCGLRRRRVHFDSPE
jgi:hypothetical protein